LGSMLMDHLIQIARIKGVRGFRAKALPEDAGMQRLMQDRGFTIETALVGDVHELTIHFRERADDSRGRAEGPVGRIRSGGGKS